LAKNNKSGGDTFEALSKKLRLERVNKEEIHKIHNEAVQNEKLKSKIKRSVLLIQRLFRGYIARKKFKTVM
jgi:hypothetical protein